MEFSVVIPTYNRAPILARTLRALPADNADFTDYEVIVVDDGSTDGTADVVHQMQESFPVALHYLRQPNRKQGAARNLGARQAAGDYLIFLGDDTIPASDFLREHARSHLDRDCRHVVIGYTRWAEDFPVTRFMEYIGEQGWQFGFSLIENPEDLPFNFFYTSNVSLARAFFWEGGGFDEGFQEYGWEDIELSLRLKKQGMRLTYNPRAVAYHHHPTSLCSFIQRQRKVGCSAWNFYQRHPEMAGFLGVLRARPYSTVEKFKMALLTWACCLTEKAERPDLSRYYPDLMTYYYNLGVLKRKDQELPR